ncbi:MAG: hypothetical protein H0W61_11160 [Bacteroidetes bacterium]|nr:hypothetical protein [Bacteroidota bacterium]
MHSAISSIGKNLILLGLLALSAINFLYGWFSWKDLLIIQSLTGLAYIFLSCYEFLNAQYKAMLPVKRYPYFNNSYIMFKVLKICVFLSFASILYLSGTRIKYLYPICIIIALTETIVTFLKYRRALCFVSIYANYILFSADKLSRVFASEIELVEFRHDILYFVKKDKKALQVKMVHIEERDVFMKSINEWLTRNKVQMGEESGQKLRDIAQGRD